VKNVECVDLVKSFPTSISIWSRTLVSIRWKLLIPRRFCWFFVLLRTVAYVFHLFWALLTSTFDWLILPRTDPSELLLLVTCTSSLLSRENTSAQSWCQARVVKAAPVCSFSVLASLCWLFLLPDTITRWYIETVSFFNELWVRTLFFDTPNICWKFLLKFRRFSEFLRIRLSWHQ